MMNFVKKYLREIIIVVLAMALTGNIYVSQLGKQSANDLKEQLEKIKAERDEVMKQNGINNYLFQQKRDSLLMQLQALKADRQMHEAKTDSLINELRFIQEMPINISEAKKDSIWELLKASAVH